MVSKGTIKMAQSVKVLATKLGSLSLIHGSHMVDGDSFETLNANTLTRFRVA